MSAQKKNKKPSSFDLSHPDSLRGLDEETLLAIISRLFEQNRQLSETLQAIMQERYGRKSERFEDSNQLRLFASHDESIQSNQSSTSAESEAPEQTEQPERKRKGSTRQRNPRRSNLKQVKVPAKHISPEELICNCCGVSLVKVNHVVLHTRYDYQPASICVQDIVEDVFACPGCEPELVEAAQLVTKSENSKYSEVADALAPEILELLKTQSDATVVPTSNELIDGAVQEALSQTKKAACRVARCEATPNLLSYIVGEQILRSPALESHRRNLGP